MIQPFIKTIACVQALLFCGCVFTSKQPASQAFTLPKSSAVAAIPIISEVTHSGGLAFDDGEILYFANFQQKGTIGVYNSDDTAPPETFIDLNDWMTYNDRSPDIRGLAMDAQGRLVGADAGTGKIIRVSADARKVEVLADSYEGMLFNGLSDVALAPDGIIFASSPEEGVIYRILPMNGKVEILNRELVRADGLAITPDGTRLVVAEPDVARLLVYSLEDQLSSAVPVATLDFSDSQESPHGVAFDQEGHLYVAMGDSGLVQVFDLADSRLLRSYQAGGSVDRLLARNGTLWLSGGRLHGLRKIRLN